MAKSTAEDKDNANAELLQRKRTMSLELKIKGLSLAQEARIIRKYEKKHKALGHTDTNQKLYWHRVGVVRPEARATHLARMFLKGRKYCEVEQKAYTLPYWGRIAVMIKRYGGREYANVTPEQIVGWINQENAPEHAERLEA